MAKDVALLVQQRQVKFRVAFLEKLGNIREKHPVTNMKNVGFEGRT